MKIGIINNLERLAGWYLSFASEPVIFKRGEKDWKLIEILRDLHKTSRWLFNYLLSLI